MIRKSLKPVKLIDLIYLLLKMLLISLIMLNSLKINCIRMILYEEFRID